MHNILPAHAEKALALLDAAGFCSVAVGGAVRDALLGRPAHDWDLATAATPDEMKRVFSGFSILETGIRHGTLTVRLPGGAVEITTFRRDGVYSDGRHPDEVAFSRELDDDLARRDFTVNALCLDAGGDLIDRVDGLRDLRAGVLRAVGDPPARFAEDALRIVRGLRLAAQLGFSIEPRTADAMHRLRGRLNSISAERIFSELSGLLTAPDPGGVLREFADIVTQMIPELSPCVGLSQRADYHCRDVYGHTVCAVVAAPPDLALRLALLLHDVGKPLCADGAGHFHGHEAQSARLARQILTRLRCPGALSDRVVRLVELHGRPLTPDRRLLRRRLAAEGEGALRDLLQIRRADLLAQRPEPAAARLKALEEVSAALEALLAESPALTLRDLAVDGTDLMAAGIPAGPELGRALRRLLEAVVDEALPNRRDALLEAALKLKNDPEE